MSFFLRLSDNELKLVALKSPVEGLKNSFDEDTPRLSVLPEEDPTNAINLVSLVVVSSFICITAADPVKPMLPAKPCDPAKPVAP